MARPGAPLVMINAVQLAKQIYTWGRLAGQRRINFNVLSEKHRDTSDELYCARKKCESLSVQLADAKTSETENLADLMDRLKDAEARISSLMHDNRELRDQILSQKKRHGKKTGGSRRK